MTGAPKWSIRPIGILAATRPRSAREASIDSPNATSPARALACPRVSPVPSQPDIRSVAARRALHQLTVAEVEGDVPVVAWAVADVPQEGSPSAAGRRRHPGRRWAGARPLHFGDPVAIAVGRVAVADRGSWRPSGWDRTQRRSLAHVGARNGIGPAAPAELTVPGTQPCSVLRPWSHSILPIAARIAQSTPSGAHPGALVGDEVVRCSAAAPAAIPAGRPRRRSACAPASSCRLPRVPGGCRVRCPRRSCDASCPRNEFNKPAGKAAT